jgi:hypothetical protein
MVQLNYIVKNYLSVRTIIKCQKNPVIFVAITIIRALERRFVVVIVNLLLVELVVRPIYFLRIFQNV